MRSRWRRCGWAGVVVGLALSQGVVVECCRQRHQCHSSPVVGRLSSLTSEVERQAGDVASGHGPRWTHDFVTYSYSGHSCSLGRVTYTCLALARCSVVAVRVRKRCIIAYVKCNLHGS